MPLTCRKTSVYYGVIGCTWLISVWLLLCGNLTWPSVPGQFFMDSCLKAQLFWKYLTCNFYFNSCLNSTHCNSVVGSNSRSLDTDVMEYEDILFLQIRKLSLVLEFIYLASIETDDSWIAECTGLLSCRSVKPGVSGKCASPCSSTLGAAELRHFFMPLSFVALIQCSSCLFFFGFSAFIGTK